MSKILAIFGATGTQGGSVLNSVLNDPELSKTYKIRAITRDANSEKAKQLKEKVEVVSGDASDRASLETALDGAHTVFAMTTPSFGPDAVEVEYNAGKAIADVAVAKGAQYLIWSTLPAVTEISSGKYTKVTGFDAKYNVEQYVRTLPIKSAFFSGGLFMENCENQPFLNPTRATDGSDDWILSRCMSAQTKVPMICARDDTGKFVGAILADPEKYESKVFCAATRLYSMQEIAEIMSRATGKRVRYQQISRAEMEDMVPFGKELFGDGFMFMEEYGYFGPGTEKLVTWAAENARGRPTTFEEYFEKHPLKLE